MKHVFYILSILPILWEITVISQPVRVHNFIKTMKQQKSYELLNSTQKMLSVLMLGYWVWIFTGLFTFQWPIYIMYICFSLIPKSHYLLRWFDAVLSLLTLLFILINAYHLKIDVLALVKSI